MKFAFVILHFGASNITNRCISSIFDLEMEDYNIVVVNNSAVKSEFFNMDKKVVHVIDAGENLGFAKGNNLGYRYAKHCCKADFIVMLNNDTYFLQKDFVTILQEEYKQQKFAVCGPLICSKKYPGGV